jgi:outer membrane protein assembly factor BamD
MLELMKPLRHLIAALAAAALCACASGIDVTQPDPILMDNANNFYARGRYSQAVDLYRKSVEHNPDSPYRKGAAMGLADALYKEKEYFEAVLYYERFTELYPLDPATPRAYFYLAMCYYTDAHSPDRDQSNTRKAIKAFARFIEKYPNHQLAPLVKNYSGEMESRLLDSEMQTIRFYHKTNKHQAAIWRIKDHMRQYPASPYTEELLFMLGESYYKEQSYKEAASVFITLMEKNPGGVYSVNAAKLAQNIKLQGK